MPKSMVTYNSDVLNCRPIGSTTSVTSAAMQVLHDNDVNRYIGWAVINIKTKYNKIIQNGSTNNIYKGKLEMLEDMVLVIGDVVEDTAYMRLYY